MAFAFRVMSAIGALIGIAWAIAAPGYEPILACVGAVGVFLSTFMSSPKAPEVPAVIPEPEPPLTADATELLSEIDACTEGAKGLTIIFAEPTMGDYRPYLNTAFHDPPGGARITDISRVIVAAAELEERGFLFALSATEASRQYKRTGRQP